MSDPRAIGAPQAWLDYGPAATPAHTGMALSTKVALALSVFVVLFFAQGWASPLVGYTIILDPKWGPFFRNVYLPVYGISLYLAATRAGGLAFLRSPLLIALILLSFISTTWSIAPDMTFRRAIALAFTVVASVGLATRWSWPRLCEIVGTAFAVMAVASILMGLVYPKWGVMHELFPGAWRGLWPEKNALGAINTFGLIFCTAAAILVPKRKWIWLAFSVLCFGLILMSTSKTSLLAALLALSCMAFVLMFRAGRVWAVISVWGAVSVALALTGLVFAAPELLFQAIGKDATLTGRTELWAAALHQWESHKLLGFGYSVFWERLSPWSPVEWVVHDAGFYVGHAHNGWLETLLSLGLVGIAVWSLCYLEIVIRALCSVVSSPGAYVILPFLVVFTLRSITEVAIIDFHDIEWLLFIAAAVKIASPRSWEEDRAELAETG